MDFQRKKGMFFLSRTRLSVVVIGTAVLAVSSCGSKTGNTAIPSSAVAPRKSVTLAVAGDTLVTAARQDTLLAIARRSIARYLETGSNPPAPPESDSALLKKQGCLIRLTVDNKIRGTSGYIMPIKELASAVWELAGRAASGGQRYSPLTPKEFGRAVIQISVVSEPATIASDAEIQVKKHGLVLLSNDCVAGILLADDVIQSGSAAAAVDRLLALNNMKRKDWKSPEVKIQTFTVQVFQEMPR